MNDSFTRAWNLKGSGVSTGGVYRMLRESQTRTVFILFLFFLSLTAPRAVFADVVTDWNEMLTMALRVAGGGPGTQHRPAAIVSAAVFDAIQGHRRKHK